MLSWEEQNWEQMKSVQGLTFFSPPPAPVTTPSTLTPKSSSTSPTILPFNFPHHCYYYLHLKSQHNPQFNPRKELLFSVRASDDNNNTTNNKGEEDKSDPPSKDDSDDDENKQKEIRENGGKNGNGNGNGRPKLNLKWVDLLLDPDPDNVVAVGLTGVLAWASVQVLWQLFVISIAILLAALKYSFIAALLIFILITLL